MLLLHWRLCRLFGNRDIQKNPKRVSHGRRILTGRCECLAAAVAAAVATAVAAAVIVEVAAEIPAATAAQKKKNDDDDPRTASVAHKKCLLSIQRRP